jgi:ferredoxin
MPIVTFIHPDGTVQTVEGPAGESVLKIALDGGVPMEHACGGNGFCTTCMCEVQEGMSNTSPRNDREENMGVVEDPKRLGCQTKVNGDITVKLLDN